MWPTIYHLVIYPCLLTAMRIAAFWSLKVRRALRGRSDWRGPVSRIPRPAPGTFRIHFHAASVGEFEQAKPLIEMLRREKRPFHITASFFSPSGFESQKEYPLIDGACYIPHDRQGEMNEFMNRITPDLILIVRYDLWLEFMRQAELRSIPVVLVCGVLRSNSIRFFPGLRPFFVSLYRRLALIHCVGEDDRTAFGRLVPDVPIQVSGDTRYDRVAGRLKGNAPLPTLPLLRSIAGVRRIVVAGSTWPDDERLLASLAGDPRLFLVIVPHEPEPETVRRLLELFPDSTTLSSVEEKENIPADGTDPLRTIIVDRMGILAGLYPVGDISFVGGGFGAGVHSVLEPAACSLPVLCGPRIERSRDAVALHDAGLLRVVATSAELVKSIEEWLLDNGVRRQMGERTGRFVEERLGATERIIRSLHDAELLPAEESVPDTSDRVNTLP